MIIFHAVFQKMHMDRGSGPTKEWILIHHLPAVPSQGILLAASVNFLLSITSGMTTLMFQQVSFDGSQTKSSSKAALPLETVEGYGVQPK